MRYVMSEQPDTALKVCAVLHEWYAVLQVSGEFRQDAHLGVRLRDELARLPLPDPPCLVIDLQDITAWDEFAIGAILSTAKRVMTNGGHLAVAAAPADFLAHVQRVGLERVFRCHETVDQAVGELWSGQQNQRS
ncbi:STAS domain-containing protein [Streptosporangiaceae bacterium NEAU-GS5]|nr:STAS domain-containing protein [Streptosporangiaceae bacterium NEAU-GS5]